MAKMIGGKPPMSNQAKLVWLGVCLLLSFGLIFFGMCKLLADVWWPGATVLRDAGKDLATTIVRFVGARLKREKEEAVGPNLALSWREYDFGEVYPDSSVSCSLVVWNSGDMDLSLFRVQSRRGEFSVDTGRLPRILAPQESLSVEIQFTPLLLGPARGELTISSDDPDTALARVALRGTGIELPPVEGPPEYDEERVRHLARIFSAMRPPEVASILGQMDDDTIVAVLMKVQDRKAGEILAALEPSFAADIGRKMVLVKTGMK